MAEAAEMIVTMVEADEEMILAEAEAKMAEAEAKMAEAEAKMAEAEAKMAEAKMAKYDRDTRAVERRRLLRTFTLPLSPGRQLSRDGLGEAEAKMVKYDRDTRAVERRSLLRTFTLPLGGSPGRQLSRDGLAEAEATMAEAEATMAEAEAKMADAEAANYDSETRAEERRILLETFDVALDDSPGRQLSRDGLATVFSILEIVISEHEQQRVFDCYSTDGFFGEKEFLACFMRRYERSELWRVFNEQDREGKGTLFMSEANAAVVSLGNKCKGAEFRKLVKYFDPETRKLDFRRFCMLASDWALFLSVDDPVEFPEPGKWADTVAEIHSIFSKVCATMLVFVPIVLKADSTKKIPFLSQKDKTPGDNCIDSALAICTSLWALFYLCSFAARGTIFWKLFDGVSLVCALGTTSILMSFVNLYMAVIPLITSVVALASLWLLSQKIVPAGAKANFMRKYFV